MQTNTYPSETNTAANALRNTAAAAKDFAAAAKSDISNVAQSAVESARDFASESRAAATRQLETTSKWLATTARENPFRTLGIAVVVGALVAGAIVALLPPRR
jgi:ElaB/YqjD/DUF883 family membrane-anchored ribosome-binding protein